MSRSPIEQHYMALKRFMVWILVYLHFRKPLCVIKFVLMFYFKFLYLEKKKSTSHTGIFLYNNTNGHIKCCKYDHPTHLNAIWKLKNMSNFTSLLLLQLLIFLCKRMSPCLHIHNAYIVHFPLEFYKACGWGLGK